MNREIKFRIWSFNEKIFHYFDVWEGFSGFYGGHSEPQQFTGVKDRKGKEIYEGDILSVEDWDRDNLRVKVIYCSRTLGFKISKSDGMIFDNFPASLYLEVIGNIFENKELLTESPELSE